MPAKDKYHDAIVHALEKEGWKVESQILLKLARRRVWIDARATQNDDHSIIMIEIKGFENMNSPVDYLASRCFIASFWKHFLIPLLYILQSLFKLIKVF